MIKTYIEILNATIINLHIIRISVNTMLIPDNLFIVDVLNHQMLLSHCTILVTFKYVFSIGKS